MRSIEPSVSVISLVLLVPIVEPQLSRPLFDESFTTRARSFFPPLSLSLPFTIARHLCLSGPTFTFPSLQHDPTSLSYPLSSSAHCPGSPESRPINGSPNHLLGSKLCDCEGSCSSFTPVSFPSPPSR
ncbi:hypothetical protein BDY24DRAFT_237730 [Mrakia frigida]|uniref:uncharacterized protein n=1 Tax=Mrakia frigida TaxID=29902 RepID=UPI003FCC1ED8